MVSLKTTKAKVTVAFTIILIIIFICYIGISVYLSNDLYKDNKLLFNIRLALGIITMFGGLIVTLSNNLIITNNEFSDSDKMNKAFRGIPIAIGIISFLIALSNEEYNYVKASYSPKLRENMAIREARLTDLARLRSTSQV